MGAWQARQIREGIELAYRLQKANEDRDLRGIMETAYEANEVMSFLKEKAFHRTMETWRMWV